MKETEKGQFQEKENEKDRIQKLRRERTPRRKQ